MYLSFLIKFFYNYSIIHESKFVIISVDSSKTVHKNYPHVQVGAVAFI